MPIYGDLSDLPLHLLLQALMRAGQTGRLTLRTQADEVTLLFERGRIAAASTGDLHLRLGQLLLQRGEISEEDLEQALALQAVSTVPRRLGEILVSLGFVTHQQIKRALANQFEEALVRVLTAREASFAFTPEPVSMLTEETILEDQPATMVILNAIRRADEAAAPLGLVPQAIDPGILDRLTSTERAVLSALIEGARTIRQLVEATGLARDVVRQAIDSLRARGLLAGTTSG